jgi:predicted nucleic acid-binding protein
MFLLDTNVISELRKPKPHGAVLGWVKANQHERSYISAVSVGEIQRGVELTRDQDITKANEIEQWLGGVIANYEILPMNAYCFKQWAKLMHHQSNTRMADAMIAATAITFNLTVVTRNVSDFEHFDCAVFNPFEYKL